jgi:hypothetical protein
MKCFRCQYKMANRRACWPCRFRLTTKEHKTYCQLETFPRPYLGVKEDAPHFCTIKQCERCDSNKMCKKVGRLKAQLQKELDKGREIFRL